MEDSATTPAQRAVLRAEVERTLAVVNPSLRISELRIVVIADPAGVIPEIGLGGFTPDGHEVRLYVDAGRPDAEEVFRRELLPLLAHEPHHAGHPALDGVRRRLRPGRDLPAARRRPLGGRAGRRAGVVVRGRPVRSPASAASGSIYLILARL